MTKVVIYSNANLESFYEQTLQYLHEKYHSYPTMLDYGPLCAEESARISYYDGMARENVRHTIKGSRSHDERRDLIGVSSVDGVLIGKGVF